MTIIDVATKAVVTTVPVDAGPVGAWPGKDGLMYVDCEMAKTVVVIDPATRAVARRVTLGFTPGMAMALASGELWVTDSSGQVVQFDPTGTETSRFSTAEGAHGLAFSPDGERGFVTNQLASSVSIFDVATRALIKTMPTAKLPNGIVFRPAPRHVDLAPAKLR